MLVHLPAPSPTRGNILWQSVGTQTSELVLKGIKPSGQKQPSVMGPASSKALWGQQRGWPVLCPPS